MVLQDQDKTGKNQKGDGRGGQRSSGTSKSIVCLEKTNQRTETSRFSHLYATFLCIFFPSILLVDLQVPENNNKIN